MSEVIVHVFLFLHILGLAVLLGGLMVQRTPSLRAGRSIVIGGAIAQLATGIGLLAMLMADANHLKATVKLVLAATNVVIALIGLTVINVGLAVFW